MPDSPTTEYQCPWCSGCGMQGGMRGHSTKPCDACYGKGVLTADEIESEEERRRP